MESALLDNTVIRAHMCVAGGSKKTVAKPNKLLAGVEVDSAPSFTFSPKDSAMHSGSS